VEFYLDRCEQCMSVWFDRDEWAALHDRGLHDRVHLFFQDPWQRRLRAEETRQLLEKMYRERFGERDYARIREIRAWLHQHLLQGALVAYLTDKDPYRAISP
jgi:Zn-finger nucleic acid-binding protein